MTPGSQGRGSVSRRQVLVGLGVGALGVGVGGAAIGVGRGGAEPSVSGRSSSPARGRPGAAGRAAADVDGDVVQRWGRHYLALVKDNGIPAPAAAGMLAEMGVVLHAAASGRSRDVRPLHELGEGALRRLVLPRPPDGVHPGALADAALGYLVPRRYVDSAGPAMVTALTDAERAIEAQPQVLRRRTREAGAALGQAVLDWYLTVLMPRDQEPVPRVRPRGPGSWVATPPAYDQPVLPHWGRNRTLVLASGAALRPPAPPSYSEDPASECHRLAVEVRDTVAGLDDEQLAIAQHWADGKWTVNPPGHWLGIALRQLQRRQASFELAAETVMRLGVSQHDAFISCWWTKYHYDVLRPLTYIRRVLDEKQWLSPVVTPCFPEYTSGHATQSAAAAVVLDAVLGSGAFTDDTNPDLPARSYPSYAVAAEEAAVSRLYGGIHYRNANDAGLDCGRRLGRLVTALPVRA